MNWIVVIVDDDDDDNDDHDDLVVFVFQKHSDIILVNPFSSSSSSSSSNDDYRNPLTMNKRFTIIIQPPAYNPKKCRPQFINHFFPKKKYKKIYANLNCFTWAFYNDYYVANDDDDDDNNPHHNQQQQKQKKWKKKYDFVPVFFAFLRPQMIILVIISWSGADDGSFFIHSFIAKYTHTQTNQIQANVVVVGGGGNHFFFFVWKHSVDQLFLWLWRLFFFHFWIFEGQNFFFE